MHSGRMRGSGPSRPLLPASIYPKAPLHRGAFTVSDGPAGGFPGRAGESGDAVAEPRAWRGAGGLRSLPFRFSDGFAKKGVDGSGSGPYIGSIDGGAACERPAGFDASELISGVQRPAGFAGCVVVFPVRRFGAGRTFGGLGCPALFDNCIGRKRNVDGGVLAARFGEHCAAMRGERHSDDVTFPDSSRSGFRAGADVFGTRREVWPSGRA